MKNLNGLKLQEATDINIDGCPTMKAMHEVDFTIESDHDEALKMNCFCDEFDAEHKDDDIIRDWAYASLLNAQIDLWQDAAKPTIYS